MNLKEIADKLNIDTDTIPATTQAQITEFVKKKVFKSLITAGEERTQGIHVSALLKDCTRSACYKELYGGTSDLRGIYKTGIGTILHAGLKILEVQELKLEWEGIVTDGVDEYSPETGIFIDKKFTWGPPNYGMWPYHEKQLENYRVMLRKNGYLATHGFIVYFNLMNINSPIHVRYMRSTRSDKMIEREMLSKRNIILRCRETGELPDRVIGKDCLFCSSALKCLNGIDLDGVF